MPTAKERSEILIAAARAARVLHESHPKEFAAITAAHTLTIQAAGEMASTIKRLSKEIDSLKQVNEILTNEQGAANASQS